MLEENKKRKTPAFWFLITTIFWCIIIFICTIVMTIVASQNEGLKTRISNVIKEEITGEETDIEEEEKSMSEDELKTLRSDIKNDLEEVLSEFGEELKEDILNEIEITATPAATPTPGDQENEADQE